MYNELDSLISMHKIILDELTCRYYQSVDLNLFVYQILKLKPIGIDKSVA